MTREREIYFAIFERIDRTRRGKKRVGEGTFISP